MKLQLNFKLSPAGAIVCCALLLLTACSKTSALNEKAYVVPERAKLRNSTAQAARVTSELKGGDQVTVTRRANSEDGNNWSNVKASSGESGWIESRNLVKENIVEKSRKIADEIKDIPTQATGKSKASLKLRLTPDRVNEENVATTLPVGTALEIVARDRKLRPTTLPINQDKSPDKGNNKGDDKLKKEEIRYDEWLQVRLRDYAVLPAGWIYGGSVELDVPSDIVYFASVGRRITGWQKIVTVPGNDSKAGEHYLLLERKAFDADDRVDFDRIKVMAYDPKSRSYTTPFRDEVLGRFPVTLKMDGPHGSFQLKAFDKNGQSHEVQYLVEMLGGGKVKIIKPGKPGKK